MSPRWMSLAVVAAGAAVLGLSFVPGWLVHQRVLLGEGPRTLLSYPSAWEGESLPVLAAGVACVIAAALVALAAVIGLARLRPMAITGLLAIGVGLLAGSWWPVSQSGHASGVSLSAGWSLMVATAIAIVALLAAVLAWRPAPALAGAVAVVVLVAGIASVLGRQAWLDLQENSTEHYATGSYTRAAIAGEPTETLTLSGSTFRFDDRWSGSYEPNGLVIVFTGDPACPSVRGSYHAQAAGGQDIRFDAIVDLCANGKRQHDLESGTWVRDR